MSETFFLILLGMCFAFVLGTFTIYLILFKTMKDKYLLASKKLQLLVNNLDREYGELVEKPSAFMGGALGDMGVDGIIDALGIPAIFKPIAKGFVDNIMKDPAKLQGILKKLGVDVNVASEPKDTVPSQM